MRKESVSQVQETQRVPGRLNPKRNMLRYTVIKRTKINLHHLYGRKLRGTKEPPDEVKEESEKAGLKLNIQKTKTIASGPITSQQIDGETVESNRLIFLGSKISADGDCSHEIKRCLFLWRKAMTDLDSILKSRDIPLPTNVRIVKATLN